jgi:hypothetical protein
MGENGQLVFDASRGLASAFNADNRGRCGNRSGYLKLRITLTLLLGTLDLQGADQGSLARNLGFLCHCAEAVLVACSWERALNIFMEDVRLETAHISAG